jgi:hypothetical protein
MYTTESFIVFPEGDTQEIEHTLHINELVDINGNPLALPLATNRCIAFRVSRRIQKENRGGEQIFHYLELLSAAELLSYVG